MPSLLQRFVRTYHGLILCVTLPVMQGTRDAWVQAGGIIRTDRELHKLFTTLALRYHARPGGYTRLLRAGWRQHDAAPAAFVE